MEGNWVDKKAHRESILRDRADGVWQDARSAIQDCCESARKHYGKAIEDITENGHRIRLTISFPDPNRGPHDVKRVVLVRFVSSAPCIEVTIDDSASKKFTIDADGEHAYILGDSKEITVDEFSRIALQEALFKSPERIMQFPKSVPMGSDYPSGR